MIRPALEWRKESPDLYDPYRINYVCTGNICRSPMAAAMTQSMAETVRLGDGTMLSARLVVSSSGTGPWHEGEPMDERAQRALAAAGYLDRGHLAHQFRAAEFDDFDLIVALDRRHLQTLRSLGKGRAHPEQLVLLRSFDPKAGGAADVEDPYYGDAAEFERCRAVVEAGCRGLVDAVVELMARGAPH
jgi:protein-tyrosine phosphatase